MDGLGESPASVLDESEVESVADGDCFDGEVVALPADRTACHRLATETTR